MRAEQLTPAAAYHGEGPVWISGGGAGAEGLLWVDMLAGDVLSLAEDGAIVRRHVGPVVALVRPRAGGGLVYALDRGFALEDGPDAPLVRLPELWSDTSVRMNEGGCDPAGRLYCGSMAYDGRPGAGVLYRLDPDHSVHVVQSGLTVPNGLGWTAAGDRAFHVDSAAGRVDVLSWDAERGLQDRRPFVTLDAGTPDGLAVDVDGGVWVAVWGGGAVHHYDADGRLADVVEVPARQVSACAFGGPELDRLFITTSRENLADPEPGAGAVFTATPGVRGVPVRAFAG